MAALHPVVLAGRPRDSVASLVNEKSVDFLYKK
jgi:hypothetical protein